MSARSLTKPVSLQSQPQVQQAAGSGRRVRPKAATSERLLPSERQARQENVSGNFYVDHTCIDCDTCRWMDGKTFSRVNGQTAVHHQPEGPEERQAALEALLACPTYSIHCSDRSSAELKAAVNAFPKPVPGSEHAFHCGFTSEDSFAAHAYLLIREGGNVMVDCPRYHPQLLKNIQAKGGVKYMFLTHRDDVCDHVKWASALGCDRIIHELEANHQQQTSQCEVKLSGEGPWKLPDGGDDVQLIFTPGHTEGHVVMLYHPEQVLFSGDHLMFRAAGNLSIAPWVNWWSTPHQVESAKKVSEYDIRVLLPGHGRRGYFADTQDKQAQFNSITPKERRR